MKDFVHVSVLLNEAVDGLAIRPDGVYIDGTAGGGGHSAEILKHLGNGHLYCVDQDPDAIATVSERFKDDPRAERAVFKSIEDLPEVEAVQ